MALQIAAMLAGESVMLGWQHMVADDLRSGQLVLAHRAIITVGCGKFLCCQIAALLHPAVARFVAHLLQSLTCDPPC